MAKAAPGRNWWPTRYTRSARAPPSRSSKPTAPPSPENSSEARCSATSKAASPARTKTRWAPSRRTTAAPVGVLIEYDWPGNVRELKNLIERIVILNPQVRVDARHIPLQAARRQPDRPLDRFGSLQEVREAAEREYILKKLEETNGNVTRTAELLGLERSNLYRKMKTLGIGPKEES